MGGEVVSETVRVVIADDHTLVRKGLKSLLKANKEYDVVGEAENGIEAIRTIRDLQPDIVLLDLSMPKMDGISVIREIKQVEPDTRILALTMYTREEYVLDAFNSGADGYCLKSSSHEELLLAMKSILAGKFYVSPEISGKVLEGFLEGTKHIREKSSWDTLTQREREVLKLVGEGYQNKEIADLLCISVKTVEKHRANIMQKLDLHSASALTAYAIEKGLVTT
jgi:DNA-binding NarL/FixJ family response regulator